MTMADKLKNVRSHALSNFTRSYNNFNSLHDAASPKELVTAAFQKVDSCWNKLEEAQERFIEVTDIDVENDNAGLKYLDAPGERHSEVFTKYAIFMKQTSADERVHLQRKADEDRDIEAQQRAKEAEDAKAAAAEKVLEETENKFNSAKVELEMAVEVFNRMVLGVQGVVCQKLHHQISVVSHRK